MVAGSPIPPLREFLGFSPSLRATAERVAGTFSIVAVDPTTAEVGCAVQSRYFAIGAVTPWVRAGVGAVATQAMGVVAGNGRLALDALARDVDTA